MTISRIATITVLSLASATGAFAQSAFDTSPLRSRVATVQMDPLDPVSRVAILARRGLSTPVATPVRVAVRPAVEPAQVYQAPPALEQAPNSVAVPVEKPSRFLAAVQGISQSLQLSHEALDVYEHAIEANALKNAYRPR